MAYQLPRSVHCHPSRQRTLRHIAASGLFALLSLTAAACSDAPPSSPPSDIGGLDLAFDLGRDQGGDQGGDLGSQTDSAFGDAGVECQVEVPVVLGTEAGSVIQRVALTHYVNDFAVAFRERRTAVDDLWVRVYRDTPSGTVAGTDYAVTTDAAGASVSSVSRDPALVATDTGYIAAWIDSRDMGFELWTRMLDADGVPASALQRLTTSAGAAASPSLARASDGTLLAGYVHDDTLLNTTSELHVATLSSSGALQGSWARVSDAGELATSAAVVRGQAAGFLSGWIDGAGNVRVRPVTVAGAGSGSVVTHGSSSALALNPTILLFARNTGFDGLWAQAITSAGSADGLLRSALTSDASGVDPSVAPLSGGVVVAYRHTTASGTQIALALLNSRGERIHTELLGTTTSSGGPISVAVNNEGRIRLAWAEVDGGTTTTYTQAVQCQSPL